MVGVIGVIVGFCGNAYKGACEEVIHPAQGLLAIASVCVISDLSQRQPYGRATSFVNPLSHTSSTEFNRPLP